MFVCRANVSSLSSPRHLNPALQGELIEAGGFLVRPEYPQVETEPLGHFQGLRHQWDRAFLRTLCGQRREIRRFLVVAPLEQIPHQVDDQLATHLSSHATTLAPVGVR